MFFLTQKEELELKDDGVQALYFYAQWMPFHKKMLAMIDAVQEKHKNIEFLAIDTDYFKVLCKKFNVKSIPTVLIFKNGKEIRRTEGLILTKAFKHIFLDI